MFDEYPIPDSLPIRERARLVALKCFMTALQQGGGMGDAVRLFKEQWNTDARSKDGSAVGSPEHFVPNQVKHMFIHADLHDDRDAHTATKMPDAKVKEAAAIIADGYPLPCWDTSSGVLRTWVEQRHFTSITQAQGVSKPLRDIMEEYDVTPRYLLDRMHQLCPDLVYSALPIKMELSPAQRLTRQRWAEQMLSKLAADPLWLHKIIWGDETRIYVGRDLHGKLKVWHYRGETEAHSPEECSLLNKENVIRLDVLLFVSAAQGCCHVEFLTGTTDIKAQGRCTAGMAAAVARRLATGQGYYKVGW